jgi:hypothetical protein
MAVERADSLASPIDGAAAAFQQAKGTVEVLEGSCCPLAEPPTCARVPGDASGAHGSMARKGDADPAIMRRAQEEKVANFTETVPGCIEA